MDKNKGVPEQQEIQKGQSRTFVHLETCPVPGRSLVRSEVGGKFIIDKAKRLGPWLPWRLRRCAPLLPSTVPAESLDLLKFSPRGECIRPEVLVLVVLTLDVVAKVKLHLCSSWSSS